MFLGRFLKGEVVGIPFTTATDARVPTAPDAAPGVIVYRDGTAMKQKKAPMVDRYRATGVFFLPLHLDHDFTASRYSVLVSYILSSTSYAEVFTFQVLTTGDPDGSAVGLHMMEMPHADYAVMLSEFGRLKKLRNPRSV